MRHADQGGASLHEVLQAVRGLFGPGVVAAGTAGSGLTLTVPGLTPETVYARLRAAVTRLGFPDVVAYRYRFVLLPRGVHVSRCSAPLCGGASRRAQLPAGARAFCVAGRVILPEIVLRGELEIH
jgi:hypothetical protein